MQSARMYRYPIKISLSLLCWVIFNVPNSAAQREICIYQSKKGEIVQVNSSAEVPEEFQKSARCFPAKGISGNLEKGSLKNNKGEVLFNANLSKPEDIELNGLIRVSDISSPLGRVSLRWPRKIETLFGRSPERAVIDSARTVSRTLKSGGFPTELRNLAIPWKIVFLDEELPEEQIPSYLISNCHPAWMTSPSNLYFVAQRIVAGCGEDKHNPTSVNDAQLAQVILHEMGHAVEFQLLMGKGGSDAARSEGFATWFEQYSSERSQIIPKGKVWADQKKLAQKSFSLSPLSFTFDGSAYSYARASLYFRAVIERQGVPSLIRMYDGIREKSYSVPQAMQSNLGWDKRKIQAEIEKLIR